MEFALDSQIPAACRRHVAVSNAHGTVGEDAHSLITGIRRRIRRGIKEQVLKGVSGAAAKVQIGRTCIVYISCRKSHWRVRIRKGRHSEAKHLGRRVTVIVAHHSLEKSGIAFNLKRGCGRRVGELYFCSSRAVRDVQKTMEAG